MVSAYHEPAPAPYHEPAPAYNKPTSHHKPAAYKEEPKQPAHYAFEYGVHDEYSGTNFGQNEKRDGYATSGSYTVLLPDGRTQVGGAGSPMIN